MTLLVQLIAVVRNISSKSKLWNHFFFKSLSLPRKICRITFWFEVLHFKQPLILIYYWDCSMCFIICTAVIIVSIWKTILIQKWLTNCTRLIKDLLSGTTRILVTHATHFLSEVDRIVVMDRELLDDCDKTKVVGKISHIGTYSEFITKGLQVNVISRRVKLRCRS